MPVRVEIIKGFFVKKVGTFSPGKISPFANYTPQGEKEILVLDCRKEDITTVYRANPDMDEIDIEEGGLDDSFKKITELEKGEEFYIEASKNRNGQTRLIRFTQE